MEKKRFIRIILFSILIFAFLLFLELIIVSIYHKDTVGIIIRTELSSAGETCSNVAYYKYILNNKTYYQHQDIIIDGVKNGYKFEVQYFPIFPSMNLAKFSTEITNDTTLYIEE